MGVVMKKYNISYSEYLNKLSKEEITFYLNFFDLKYKTNNKKEILINILVNSSEEITKYAFNLFQNDELKNLKIVIKTKGYVEPKTNYLLKYFLDNLNRLGMVYKLEDDKYIMPKEILKNFKEHLKDKKLLKKIKNNTKEYNLIMGILNVYGVLKFKDFYTIYNKIYSINEQQLFENLNILKKFYEEFNIIKTKKDKYICNNYFQKEADCKKYINIKLDYKEFSKIDLLNVSNYKYMTKYKSYKKMLSFVKKNYYLDEKDIRIFHKYIILPYLNNIQTNNNCAEENLSKSIDKYFEYKNEKHKTKFINLIKNIIDDYPMWLLHGYSNREEKCQN